MKTFAIIAGMLALVSFVAASSVLFIPLDPKYPELYDHIFFSGIITGCGFTLLFLILCWCNRLNTDIEDEKGYTDTFRDYMNDILNKPF